MPYTCDCDESFDTLTELRLHQQDDCAARERFADIDPDASDSADQAVEELRTCRGCDRKQPETFEFGYTTEFVDGSLHYICEFECTYCGFGNENQMVMEGVDAGDLGKLPAHLQPNGGGA